VFGFGSQPSLSTITKSNTAFMNSLFPNYNIGNCRTVYFLLFVSTSLCFSCKDYNTNGDPQLTYATEADFLDSTNVAFEVASGFEMKLWNFRYSWI
jgi:hypothetical protein